MILKTKKKEQIDSGCYPDFNRPPRMLLKSLQLQYQQYMPFFFWKHHLIAEDRSSFLGCVFALSEGGI